jgi:ribonuclease HI
MSELKKVNIYIDGACSGNPGPGGYGIIIEYRGQIKEKSGGFSNTTNNRMEIMAAIVALESLKEKCSVRIFSDSQYVVNAITKGWVKRWKSNGWMRNRKEKALNPDLWERLLRLYDRHEVEFNWIRGHEGHEENERCDQLARKAASRTGLPVDTGYK